MNTGSEIYAETFATTDSGQTADAVVALAGTGVAYAAMALLMFVLAPPAMMEM